MLRRTVKSLYPYITQSNKVTRSSRHTSKMAESVSNHVGREGLEEKLKEWNISYDTIDHPAVFTVEASLPYMEGKEGMFAKNLFLKDKKKRLYLYCGPHDADVKLNDLSKLVGASGGLRFADESVLQEKLGVTQGAVTLFAVINDTKNDVQLVLDKRFTDGTYEKINFHPMVNTATLILTKEDLGKFMTETKHEPKIVDLSS